MSIEPRTVLEPSAGNGEFVAAILRQNNEKGRIHAVEIDKAACEALVTSGLIPKDSVITQDFLTLDPYPVDGVIGNPPFVRIRRLSKGEAIAAREVTQATIGQPPESSASVWMPFVLHATRFLRAGSRLALVLPADALYVRYAFPMWKFLGQRFRHLQVVRLRERVFGDVSQHVIFLLADGSGDQTDTVNFEVYEDVDSWYSGARTVHRQIPISDIVTGDRPFQQALALRSDNGVIAEVKLGLKRIGTSARVRIGYVCGDKNFFHPSLQMGRRFGITDASLVPAIASTKLLRGAGLFTSDVDAEVSDRLFYPPSADAHLHQGDRDYIAFGEEQGVHLRYKCRVRSPWWRTPSVSVPNLIWPVFSDVPVLRINDGGYVASNSLLCGYAGPGETEKIVAAWYTSLTLLECEIEVHSLGGGVLVMVPREVANIRLPAKDGIPTGHLNDIHNLLCSGAVGEAYELGDEVVLRSLGLKCREIEEIRDAVRELRRWRGSKA